MGFIEVMTGWLSFTLHAAHTIESQEVGIGAAHSEHLFNDIEAIFPSIFMEVTYPIWENYVLFTIPLIDSAV